MRRVETQSILERCRLDEIDKQLEDLQKQLHDLQIQQKPQQAADVRKSIAQLRRIQNQTIKENLRLFYAGHEHQPKDLRPKQTRAQRRQLTPLETSSALKKVHRRECAFPPRTFAVKDE